MAISFGEAKSILAQFAGRGGKCEKNKDVEPFVREVLDYMLISGQYGNQRKFIFNAIKGIFTAPYELETPLKVKINGEVGSVWDQFFEYNFGSGSIEGYLPSNSLSEEVGYSPIVYDVPVGGAHIGTLAMCDEDPESHIVIKGFDMTGRQVITTHQGSPVTGEYTSIKKAKVIYTTVKFSRITEIVKTKTNGYVQLLWVRPETNERGMLADYSPFEERPQYRRFRLNTQCAPSVMISVLGRIRLKEHYADDDLIPFDNRYALSVAAQGIHANYNKDPQTAVIKDGMLKELITRENDMKKVNSGQAFDVWVPLSGGSIKNSVF